MIIVSQDKDKIVNFENTMTLKVEKLNCSEIDYTHSIYAYDNMKNIFNIGNYKTKERAKEVLQGIVSKYKTTLYNSKTNETVVNVPKVYEMPTK